MELKDVFVLLGLDIVTILLIAGVFCHISMFVNYPFLYSLIIVAMIINDIIQFIRATAKKPTK